MMALRCARKLYVLAGLLSLAACSNGRGSLDGPQTPQTPPAQAGFTIGVTVSGLVGSGLVLRNNGGDDLAISNNGPTTFSTALADGAAYDVTVATQPPSPTQTCSVANGTGRVAGANVTNVTVSCVTTGTTGSFAVSGTVAGLTGAGLVLRNNGGDDLLISADGGFDFPTLIATGAPYNVTVATQPAGQSCSIANGAGTMGGADVTNVGVTCAASAFSIGVTVSGLVGSGLRLQNNGDNLDIPTNGTFVFGTLIASGAPYSVSVAAQPLGQNCAVAKAAGTVTGANITDITVTCSSLFTIGGTVSGLAGSGLVLLLNNSNDRPITTDGSFAFANLVPTGTPYVVAVAKDPSSPSQTCSVANAAGVVGTANVTNITVTCVTNVLSVGGTVNGLSGSGLVLQKNGADDLAIASNGSFTFATEQPSGTLYSVTVKTQPTNPSQTCTIAGASGTVGGGNVRSVRVSCATNTFSISGSVHGLLGDKLVLRNSGGDVLEIQSDGAFKFAKSVASGGTYDVTVATQPANPTQACTVANGSGTVGNADIANVEVTCSTSNFMVGGRVRGLAGSGLVLRNNGADDLAVNSDGNFKFATAVPSGSTYSVTVLTQPTNPTQNCTLSNASGTVGGGDVTTVEVECVTVGFSVGGGVSGLAGSGLALQNNGADTLTIAADGAFTFPSSLNSGTPFNVTVATQPINPSQTCTVSNGAGTVTNANITSVAVSCVTNSFSVGGTVTGLRSSGLLLQNNGADSLNIAADGAFTFPTALLSGTTYNVIVAASPIFPPQTCTVSNGTGTVGAANVADVLVSCN
jgi:large repetitive protein